MENNASMSVRSNVTITVLDKNNKVLNVIKKHNKATVLMVEGLLRFLQGWYSNTSLNVDKGGGSPEDAITYIPVELGFGNVGVKLEVYDGFTNKMFKQIDSSDFVEPTFNSTELQNPLNLESDNDPMKHYLFSDNEITSYEDINNSESLRLIAKVPPGLLVGYNEYTEGSDVIYHPYINSFYDPKIQEWSTMITELGLYSSYGSLLARVLFDGDVVSEEVRDSSGKSIGYTYKYTDVDAFNNPVVQTETTTLVVEWRIGLISISDRDTFITENSISAAELAAQLSVWLQANPDAEQAEIEEQIKTIIATYNTVVSE